MALAKPLKLGDYSDSRYGETIYEILSMDDFPSPAGGIITLPSGRYKIKNSLTTSDRFLVDVGAVVTFTMDDDRYNTFTYTGTGTLFSAVNSSRILINETNILCTGVGSQFVDIDGGFFAYDTGQLVFAGANATIGDIINSDGIVFDNFTVFGYTDGLLIDDANILFLRQLLMQGSLTGTGPLISLNSQLGLFATIQSIIVTPGASESVLYIDPIITTSINISDTINTSPNSFFQTGSTGPIASFTDVSTSTTAVNVTDDSGDALFTSVAHGLVVGELPIHTTFPESSYNTSDQIVTAVPTADTYKIGIDYVSDESGLFATTTCQVNDVAHGRSNGDTLSIFETINFNGGYTVFNSQTDTFEITLGKAFPGSETTGNWDTGSLEGSNAKRSKYVNTYRNGAQPDSANIGSFLVGGNTTATDIVLTETYYDLDLDGNAVEASNNELWTLVDTTTGEMRYDGLTPFSATYRGLIATSSAGGTQRFNFQLLKNSSPLPSPDNIDIPLEVKDTIQSSPLLWSVEVEPDDLFRLQVENDDGTSDITIDTLKVEIS